MKKYIIVILFLMAIFCQLPVFAQSDLTVSGSVMSEAGEGLIGVTVVVKDVTSKGTVTDADGRFKLPGLQKGQTLLFSYLGYEKQEIKVTKTDERMRVTLKEKVSSLDELVVVGHSMQRKASIVGAISNVDVKDLKVPGTSVANML